MAAHPDTLTQSALRNRGWSLRLISTLLGDPDLRVPNPVYKSSPQLRLYKLARVEAAEQQDDFKAYAAQRSVRKAAATKAVETKKEKTKTFIEEVEIKLARFDLDDLATRARENYNAHHYREWRDDNSYIAEGTFADWSLPDQFRDRVCVNYLRHKRCQYHDHLEALQRRLGKEWAYFILFRKIMDKISFVFPELAQECGRQYQEKMGVPQQGQAQIIESNINKISTTGRCEFCQGADLQLTQVPIATRMLLVCLICAPKCYCSAG